MIYCGGFYADTMYMRDCIIIKNGMEPYTFSWEKAKTSILQAESWKS